MTKEERDLKQKWERRLKKYGLSEGQQQRYAVSAEISVSVTEDNDPGAPQCETDSKDESEGFFQLKEELGGKNFAFSISDPIVHYRSRPFWAVSDSKIRSLIVRQFPNAITKPIQRRRAARWTSVIYWYWRADLPLETIAEKLDISVSGVKALLIRIREAGDKIYGKRKK